MHFFTFGRSLTEHFPCCKKALKGKYIRGGIYQFVTSSDIQKYFSEHNLGLTKNCRTQVLSIRNKCGE